MKGWDKVDRTKRTVEKGVGRFSGGSWGRTDKSIVKGPCRQANLRTALETLKSMSIPLDTRRTREVS